MGDPAKKRKQYDTPRKKWDKTPLENEKKNIFKAVKTGLHSYIFKPVSKEVLKQKLVELSRVCDIQAPMEEEGKPKQEERAIKINLHSKETIDIDDKQCTLFLGEDISDSLDKNLKDLLKEVRIALVTGSLEEDQFKKLLEKDFQLQIKILDNPEN